MKQARFVKPLTLENVLWQFKQQVFSNCVIRKVIFRPFCPLLGTNFVLESNKLAHL